MPPFLQGRRTRAGGGGGKARHITRGTELDRLVERFISRLMDRGSEGPALAPDEIEDGPRFWTRNMPEWSQAEDPAADALAAHTYGWESDVALAEERLERELRRGNLEALDGVAPAVRTAEERARGALNPPRSAREGLTKEEGQIVRFRAYMEMRDWEESRSQSRGRGTAVTGYEMVFSFDRNVTNGDIRMLTDAFLEQPMKVVFNKKRGAELVPNPLRDLPAGAAIHGKGEHVHLLFDNRDANGAAIQIPPQVWRSFDVHWAGLWSEFERDPELFREHVQKKEQTEAWKRDARERKERGLPPAPKPERVADLFDQKGLRMRSQIVTDLKTVGLDPGKFRIDERAVCRSNDAFGRLAVRLELAEERSRHALATGAPLETARDLHERVERLTWEVERSRKARQAVGKRDEPAPLYTDREAGELARLRAERAGAEKDQPARPNPWNASPPEISPQSPAMAGPSRLAAGGRQGAETHTTRREANAPAPGEHLPVRAAAASPVEMAHGLRAQLLADEEVEWMIAEHELAKARALMLRVAEADFNAAPHRWASPTRRLSLAGVEEQVARGSEWGMSEGEAKEARAAIRAELEAERARLPRERLEAEERARTLGERLRTEKKARSNLGLPMPDGAFTADDLRELAGCAVVARDAVLLRRVYACERGWAMRLAEERGELEPLARLAERYAGAEFVSEVLADRSRGLLEQAKKYPDKVLLHTTDEAGRDSVTAFDQVAPRRGVAGALGKFIESGEKRRLREHLSQKREEYFRHLSTDAGGRESFHKVTQVILRECHDLQERFGAPWRGVPELTEAQIREVRDYAMTQQGRGGNNWLKVCAQSQKLKDERAREAAEAGRAARAVFVAVPAELSAQLRAQSPAEQRMRRFEKDIAERQREARERASKKRDADRNQPGGPRDPERGAPAPVRPPGSSSTRSGRG